MLTKIYQFLSTIDLNLLTTAYAAEAENLTFLGYEFGKTPSKLTFIDAIGFLLYLGKNLIGIAGFVAIIYMMIGGFTIVMSSGNQDQVQKGKNTLTYAIIGFLVAMSAYLIVSTFLDQFTGVSFTEIPTDPKNFNQLNPNTGP